MIKPIQALREQYYWTFVLWPQFKKHAAQDRHSPNEALARLIRRYIARGFEDGEPEQKP
jgi:hypothetical protein